MRERANTAGGYRTDIDGLRAIAVSAVVLFHSFPTRLPGGFLGVDVFFAISGYLISRIILTDLELHRFSWKRFYARRVKRIFPALVTVLSACFVVGWLYLMTGEFQELARHIVAGSVFLSNVALWQEAGYFDKAAELKPLLHLWSLGIEEQFYLVWPAAFVAMFQGPRIVRLTVLLMGLGSFCLSAEMLESQPSRFFLPASRFWELAAGGALAYFQYARPRALQVTAAVQQLASALGFGALLWSLVAFDRRMELPGWPTLFPVCGTLLLMGATDAVWINRNILGRGPLPALGRISYPLYLWHWPMLSFARILTNDSPSLDLEIALIGASLLLAWGTYRFVETPIRVGWRGNAVVWLLASAMAVVGLCGAYVYANDGLARRFPESVRGLAGFKYAYASVGRSPACWLNAIDAPDAYAPECLEAGPSNHSSLYVVWGDSHAALLYPGLLRAKNRHEFRLGQFTRNSCPPLVGHPSYLRESMRQYCEDKTSWVLERIEQERPAGVLLSCNWAEHWDGDGATTLAALDLTIGTLKQMGVPKVAIIGPLPQWESGLPRELFNFARQDFPVHRIPQRMQRGLNLAIPRIDQRLRAFVQARDGITYVSTFDLLCNHDGCLTYVGNDPSHLTTWDVGHLTEWGSEYVVSRFAPAVFQQDPNE